MAISLPGSVVVRRPAWPNQSFDPSQSYLSYGWYADELVLYFDGRPSASYSDPIDAPEGDLTAVLVRMGANDEETGEVVGIHVFPLMVGAALHYPSWRALAEPNPSPEVLSRFVAEVRDLFERYWTPPSDSQPTVPGSRSERANDRDLTRSAESNVEPEVWRTADRTGREVALAEVRLAQLLCKRPGVASWLDAVRQTIESPDRVTRDDDLLYRENSYRRFGSDGRFIKVVVHYRQVPPRETWVGEVMSAWLVDRVDSSEVPLWP